MKDEIQGLGAPEEMSNIEIFTGEKTIVEDFASRIMKCWHRTTEGILELARVCADADQQLAGPAKQALIATLPFDRATFSKLVRIGNDPRLATIALRLPQSFSTLYELSKFDDIQFAAAIKSGAVHPAVTRSQILELAAEGSSGESKRRLNRPSRACPPSRCCGRRPQTRIANNSLSGA